MDRKTKEIPVLTPEELSLSSSRTWGNDIIPEKQQFSGLRKGLTWTIETTNLQASSVRTRAGQFARDRVWPAIESIRITRKQLLSFLLLLILGLGPFVVVGIITTRDGGPLFAHVFGSKTISCGEVSGNPQNATVTGWEALFALDTTFGHLSFSQAKIIDASWDLLIGRGMQILAAWASYVVFTDALLRVIERHSASYQTFHEISLNGPSLSTTWALTKDLFRTRSKRTWSLFFYLLLSTCYVLSIPLTLSAMTGYTSVQIAWVDPRGDNNIVPASKLTWGYFVANIANVTFNDTCLVSEQLANWTRVARARQDSCDCQLSNGTVLSHDEAFLLDDYEFDTATYSWVFSDCNVDFPNNTMPFWNPVTERNETCNTRHSITILGHSYNVKDVNYEYGYCNGDQGYSRAAVELNTRCLPNTADQSYSWGFSSMLSVSWVIMQLVWAVSMYIVWQDAQINCELVRSGFDMTQHRAVFTLATAANWRTDKDIRSLVRADSLHVKEQLYGSKRTRRAEIAREMLGDGEYIREDGILRKRWLRGRSEAAGN